MIRDFSRQNLRDLSDIAIDCSNEQSDLGDLIDDMLLWLGRATGFLSSSTCGTKLTAYQKQVIDSLDMGSNEVYEIFNKIWEDDGHSGASIARIGDAVERYARGLQALTDEIELGNTPSFTANGINQNAALNNNISAITEQRTNLQEQYKDSVKDLALRSLKDGGKDAPGAILGVVGSAFALLLAPTPSSKAACIYKFINSMAKVSSTATSFFLAARAVLPWTKNKAGSLRGAREISEVDSFTGAFESRAASAKTEEEKKFWKTMETGSLAFEFFSDVYDIKTWFGSPDAADVAKKTARIKKLTEAKETYDFWVPFITIGSELPSIEKDPSEAVETVKWALKKTPMGKVYYEGKKLYDNYNKYNFTDIFSATVDFCVDASKEWIDRKRPLALIC